MRREMLVPLLAMAGVAAVALLIWIALGGDGPPLPADPTPISAPQALKDRKNTATGTPAPQRAAVSKAAPPAAAPDVPSEDALPEGVSPDDLVPDESAAIDAAWANVDLEEVRKAMPDNLYWKLGAPTTDEAVQEERAAERRRWNDEYGKVLSGTGTEEEIRAYYDYRARLAGDYIEFSTYLLDHYGDQLHERDVAFLKLARRLNNARLEEIPRKIEEAFERKRQQDAAREAWLADQEIFGAKGPDADPAGEANSE